MCVLLQESKQKSEPKRESRIAAILGCYKSSIKLEIQFLLNSEHYWTEVAGDHRQEVVFKTETFFLPSLMRSELPLEFVSECLSENELQSKKHQQEERNIKTKAASRRISATLVKLVEFSVPLSLPTLLSILLVRREVRLCKWSHQCKRIQQALMSGTLAANKWAESSPHRLSSLLVMLQLNCAANKQESRWGFARKTL